MTNEELVTLIQNGEKEHIPELWEQIEAFISLQAYKRLVGSPEHLRYLRDDMINQAYFAVLNAIDGFKVDEGKSFVGYLTFHLKGCFNDVLFGGRTERARKEPLNSSMSLDIPLDDEESITLGDSLLDESAEAQYKAFEDEDFMDSMNRILRYGIETIDGLQHDILSVMLDTGYSLTDARRALGGKESERSKYNTAYHKGLRTLRRYIWNYIRTHKGKSGIEEYVSMRTGIGSYLSHGFTSSVELAVMRKCDRDLKYANMLRCIGSK